jgi:hypothetical protein
MFLSTRFTMTIRFVVEPKFLSTSFGHQKTVFEVPNMITAISVKEIDTNLEALQSVNFQKTIFLK